MCNIMQEIVKEEITEDRKNSAIELLKLGVDSEIIAKSLKFELNYVKQLKEQIDNQDEDDSLDYMDAF